MSRKILSNMYDPAGATSFILSRSWSDIFSIS